MRTVYAKILLWSFGTLVLSLAAFAGVTVFLSWRAFDGGSAFRRVHEFEFEAAVHAYETGGKRELADNIHAIERHFGEKFYLTDSKGIDVLSGEDRSGALAAVGTAKIPVRTKYGFLVLHSVQGSPYRLLVQLHPPRFDPWSFLYYVPILLAVAGLSWLLAVNIASPLRQVAAVVHRFGAGDLDARVNVRRHDEIGDLARAFNQMAERLQTLLTSERRLLQDISHELRSPLARLSFATELIRTASDQDAAVARLRKEICRLTDLVGGLVQVTRAEGDLSERNLNELSLDELVKDVAASCQLEAAARACRIDVEASTPVMLHGDAELLRRAIENVLRNAIRYAPEATPVAVELTKHNGSANISVRDRGPGVPEEMLPKIFMPFYRVDPSRDSATGGVGLGLAIAQRAVMLHHGQLTAHNAHPGLQVDIEIQLG